MKQDIELQVKDLPKGSGQPGKESRAKKTAAELPDLNLVASQLGLCALLYKNIIADGNLLVKDNLSKDRRYFEIPFVDR